MGGGKHPNKTFGMPRIFHALPMVGWEPWQEACCWNCSVIWKTPWPWGEKNGGVQLRSVAEWREDKWQDQSLECVFFSKHLYIQKKWRKSTWNLAFLSLEVDQGDILHILVDDKSQFHRISLCAVEKDLQSCQAPFYSLKVIAREVKPHQWHVMEQWNDSFYTVVPYGNLT